MLTFADLQTEVKRRSTKDQGGTTFDEGIKTAINNALFRISREAPWRPMRRKTSFNTVISYTTGSGGCITVSNSSTATITSATLWTDRVKIDRYIKFSGSSKYHIIKTINSNTVLTLYEDYTGASSSSNTYEIYPQCEYNVPIQAGHRMFLYHEDYGYPYKLQYITDQDFWEKGLYPFEKNTPIAYRMWGEDMVINQTPTASLLSVVSSATADTNKSVTVFGISDGYPASEVITTNGSDATNATTSTNKYTSIERISKSATTTGRITVSTSGSAYTVAVIPAGDITAGVLYKKIQLYPLPTRVFPIFVQYYKDPFRLVNDGDIHELGQEFDETIILLATAKIKADSDQKEADRFLALAGDELKSLKKTNVDKIDFFPHLEKPYKSRPSFGGLYYGQVGGTGQYGPSSYR